MDIMQNIPEISTGKVPFEGRCSVSANRAPVLAANSQIEASVIETLHYLSATHLQQENQGFGCRRQQMVRRHCLSCGPCVQFSSKYLILNLFVIIFLPLSERYRPPPPSPRGRHCGRNFVRGHLLRPRQPLLVPVDLNLRLVQRHAALAADQQSSGRPGPAKTAASRSTAAKLGPSLYVTDGTSTRCHWW
jgi:hypothetical protein